VSDSDSGRAVKVVPLGDGRFQTDDGESRRTGFAVVAGDTWVFLEGRVFVVAQSGPVARRSGSDDAAALMAPMPATVVTIHVVEGEQVSADALLVSLEAMKMELPIKAPRAGRVAAIRCRAGELVQPGVPLLEIDHGS
jgi:biotin carboxyl carrier protein